jgi:hypothetical protein
LVVVATLAGSAAAREDWPRLAPALAVITVGTAACFAGPIAAWATAWERHRASVMPA